MDFFKRLFPSKSKKYEHLDDEQDSLQTSNMSIDELFVYNYKQKGGAFFYPEDLADFKESLLQLLQYLNEEEYIVLEAAYLQFLHKMQIPVTDQLDQTGILLGGCEMLIANEGAIMTTAVHTKEYRNPELPQRRVIIALSNQITPNKSQALTDINNKYEKPPANIQTMSIFARPKNDLSGNMWYETYLFLIEN